MDNDVIEKILKVIKNAQKDMISYKNNIEKLKAELELSIDTSIAEITELIEDIEVPVPILNEIKTYMSALKEEISKIKENKPEVLQ